MESGSFRNVTHSNTENGYHPNHKFTRSWLFPYSDDKDEIKAIKEANLADAIGRIAEENGLSDKETMQAFPFILRMLKSESIWAK